MRLCFFGGVWWLWNLILTGISCYLLTKSLNPQATMNSSSNINFCDSSKNVLFFLLFFAFFFLNTHTHRYIYIYGIFYFPCFCLLSMFCFTEIFYFLRLLDHILLIKTMYVFLFCYIWVMSSFKTNEDWFFSKGKILHLNGAISNA